MRLTRRQVLVGAATSGLGAVGLYELVDRLTESPTARGHGRLLPEQHLLDGVAVIRDNGVAVVVPPLHHAVVTARVVADDLRGGQRQLEEALAEPASSSATGTLALAARTASRAAAARRRPRDRLPVPRVSYWPDGFVCTLIRARCAAPRPQATSKAGSGAPTASPHCLVCNTT